MGKVVHKFTKTEIALLKSYLRANSLTAAAKHFSALWAIPNYIVYNKVWRIQREARIAAGVTFNVKKRTKKIPLLDLPDPPAVVKCEDGKFSFDLPKTETTREFIEKIIEDSKEGKFKVVPKEITETLVEKGIIDQEAWEEVGEKIKKIEEPAVQIKEITHDKEGNLLLRITIDLNINLINGK